MMNVLFHVNYHGDCLMNILIIYLFVAILLPYVMKIVVDHFLRKEGAYDNHHPRMRQAQLRGIGARALAAHQNGFESLVVFATAVLTVMVTHHVGQMTQVLASIYIVSRIIYNMMYLKDFAALRSIVWLVGFLCCLIMLLFCMM